MPDFEKQRQKVVSKAQRTLDGAGEQDDKEYGKGIEKRVSLREKEEKIDTREGKQDLRTLEKAERKAERAGGDPKAQLKLDQAVDAAIDLSAGDLADVAPGKTGTLPYEIEEPDPQPAVQPGVYAAEGDPYDYNVEADGSIRINLPGGGEAVVTADSPGTAYAAIMAQIRSGQLRMDQVQNEDPVQRVAGSPGPKMEGRPDLAVAEPMSVPPPVPPIAGPDQLKDPSFERSRMRTQALARAGAVD
jgi:hypothetical protein